MHEENERLLREEAGLAEVSMHHIQEQLEELKDMIRASTLAVEKKD